MPVNHLLSESWEGIEDIQQYKDALNTEDLNEIAKGSKPRDDLLQKKASSGPVTAKIVKHIRGGSKCESDDGILIYISSSSEACTSFKRH